MALPMINELAIPGPLDSEVHDFLEEKQVMLKNLKESLLKAHQRMKKYAN